MEEVTERTGLKADVCVTLGLVAGGRQFTIYLDGWASRGYETGFELVDNKQLTKFKGQLLKIDKDSTIICSVRTGKIDLLVGGKAITTFKDITHLSLHEAHRMPNAKALFLRVGGAKGSFQFDRIVVAPVKGKGTIIK